MGYGLEDRVPDAIASQVIREVIAPRIQAGDPDGALDAGVGALFAAIRPDLAAGGEPALSPVGPERTARRLTPGQLVFGGLLVVGRTLDPAWKARVDGTPVESLRADGFLTALRVPAGEHEVVLSYENGLLSAGLVATLLSLAAGAFLVRRRSGA